MNGCTYTYTTQAHVVTRNEESWPKIGKKNNLREKFEATYNQQGIFSFLFGQKFKVRLI